MKAKILGYSILFIIGLISFRMLFISPLIASLIIGSIIAYMAIRFYMFMGVMNCRYGTGYDEMEILP
jgi:hypothetical protein